MSNLSDLIRHAEELGLDLPFGVRQYLPFRNEQAVTTVLGSNPVVRQDKADAALAGLLTDLIAEREAREDAEAERIEAVRRYERAEVLLEQEREARERAETERDRLRGENVALLSSVGRRVERDNAEVERLQWIAQRLALEYEVAAGEFMFSEDDMPDYNREHAEEHLADLAARYEKEHHE